MDSLTKIYRLWKPISYDESWERCSTDRFDNIFPSWKERRKALNDSSKEFKEFIEQLKREHAIETGIIENLYDLDRGVTTTLIKKGFVDGFVSHHDTNVSVPTLFEHLRDQLESIDFIFDVIGNEERKLTVGFIKELHALITRNQHYAEGRGPQGQKTQIQLLKGEFKQYENNPSRRDGTKILYCPPEQVDSEMDQLVSIYFEKKNDNPVILAAWLHHAFTTIHPFQDGNGRVARLLASMVLIEAGLFPLTVKREDAKEKYLVGLEKADEGEPSLLVEYFADDQSGSIERALNLEDLSVGNSTLNIVEDALRLKLQQKREKRQKKREEVQKDSRSLVFDTVKNQIDEIRNALQSNFKGLLKISLDYATEDAPRAFWYRGQIINFAKKHNYFFNYNLPASWLKVRVDLEETMAYQLVITIHYYGYESQTLAVGAFIENLGEGDELPNEFDSVAEQRSMSATPLELSPYKLSIVQDHKINLKSIESYVELMMTQFLAKITNEL